MDVRLKHLVSLIISNQPIKRTNSMKQVPLQNLYSSSQYILYPYGTPQSLTVFTKRLIFQFARHVGLFLQHSFPISRNQRWRVQSGYTTPENYRYHIANCRWWEEGDKFHGAKGIKAPPISKRLINFTKYIRDNFSFSELQRFGQFNSSFI